MPNKTILSVDCEIPGGLSEFVAFDSNSSLLDGDIILFNADITEFRLSCLTYQGKPSLDDDHSFRLRETVDHWRRELREASSAGKTVFIFLQELQEVFIATGEREHSGTGRNRQTTRMVTEFDNYRSLPITMTPTTSHGKAMKLTREGSLIADYWREFREHSLYKVLIEGKIGNPLVVTKSGEKTVGSLIRHKDGDGAIVLLPFLAMWNDAFYEETQLPSADDDGEPAEEDEEIADEDGAEERPEVELAWTTEGIAFGKKLLNCLLEIDSALRAQTAVTPAPDWSKSADYAMPREAELRRELIVVEGKLESLEERKGQLKNELLTESLPKRLLYEKGKPLEAATLHALSVLGFSATSYRDSESEFDVVLECAEGRVLGETEGKDNKAINVQKLRQLEMNIHEDFERDEVSDLAKGVLFGNAFRLEPLEQRGEFFTEKCRTAAERSGTALVRTPDLFRIVQYLSTTEDLEFATQCRQAILSTAGTTVAFPEIPVSSVTRDEAEEPPAS